MSGFTMSGFAASGFATSRFAISRFKTALVAGVTAMVVAGALMPGAAEAARISRADKAALKDAISSCKAEAKGKKIKWLARRNYVNHCVAEALKDHPTIDVIQLLKSHPNLDRLPKEQWESI